MSFDPVFFLMQREGYITRSCICTAFNELLGATVAQKGRLYIGFFQLAIGIERAEKLVIILDHMIENQLSPPGSKATRKFGHDLLQLHDNAKSIAQSRSITQDISFESKPIHRRMLNFLTDFANGARYANLDALASGTTPKEPLTEWNAILSEIYERDLPDEHKAALLREAAARASMLQGRAVVMVHDLEDHPLSVGTMIRQELLMEAVSPYVLWNLVAMIHPITELVSQLAFECRQISTAQETAVMVIPRMDEFYDFLCLDREYVLSRRSWY
jgi:hypothetical protein